MDLPIGLLFDTITLSLGISEDEILPFKITTFYKKELVDEFLPTKVWNYFYTSNLKENMLYRTGSAKIIFDKMQGVKQML